MTNQIFKDLKKEIVIKQIKLLPKEFLQKFIESVTGEEQNKNFTLNFINSLYNMPEDKFKKFMTFIDPDVQRQLVFQLSKDNENYLTFFDNYTFLVMLNTLQKPDMIKPLIMLNQETMVNIIKILPPNMLAIVSSQIDTKLFASILQNGNMNILKRALTI